VTDEDRLRERLHERAARVPDLSDIDDVAVRLGRRRPVRERRLLAVVVVALVVGVGIGVAIGHRDDGGHSIAVAGDGSAEPTQTAGTPTDPTRSMPAGYLKDCVVQRHADEPTTTLSCSWGNVPTPTLPAPGAEQPADAVAARQAVERAWVAAYDGATSNEERAAAIEGGAGIVGVFDELRNGSYREQVRSARTVVDGIVFVSPTRARVKFHADLADGSISGPYFGDAVLNADRWQSTRASYCGIVTLAGVHCPE
jgi:hypothetical protein